MKTEENRLIWANNNGVNISTLRYWLRKLNNDKVTGEVNNVKFS